MAKQLKHGGRKLALALLLVAVVAAGYVAWQRTIAFADRPLLAGGPAQELVLDRGDGLDAVVRKLRERGVSRDNKLAWKALATRMGVAGKLQVGEYALDPGLTPRQLLERMARGQVIQRKFTIVEGWNIRELRRALASAPRLVHPDKPNDDAALMAAIGRAGVHPEGRFLPETYAFTRGTDETSILSRASKAMDVALAKAWTGRDKGLPYTSPDQLLTMASIVEKETALASERPQIAGVFVRRLRLGMLLQTDPTVIYGMGTNYAGNIRRTDLVTDTPYNTYRRAGLTPTPIAMPGRDALHAAAHPAVGAALYFVARGGGAHQFSATLDEHNAAVRRYQLRR